MAYYLYRLKNSRNFKLSFLIIFVLMSADIFLILSQKVGTGPNLSTFLSGSSEGHYMQMLLLWMIPAYLLLATSSWFLTDEKTKYSSILSVKLGKKTYLKKYLGSVFISTFLLLLLNFIINYVLAMIFVSGEILPVERYDIFYMDLQLAHPFITNAIYIITSSFFIAIFAVFVSCISFVFNKLSFVFLLSFAIWLIIITGDNSILLAFQPFNEYSISLQCTIYAIYTILLILCCLALYMYRVRKDEI